MAEHVRSQIRNRVVDALAANVDQVDGRIYQSRLYPISDEDLPGLLVYTLSEQSEREDSPTDSMRDLSLVVQGITSLSPDLDNELDALALEVETAIDQLGTIDGLAKIYGGIQSTEVSYVNASEGDKPYAAIALEFQYTYRTRAGSPGVAV